MAHADATVFDAQALMTEFQDPDVVEQLVSLLLSDLSRQTTGLQAALRDGDARAAARMAHSVGGAAGNVFAGETCQLARALEHAVREDAPDWRDQAVRLQHAMGRLGDALAAWRPEPAVDGR